MIYDEQVALEITQRFNLAPNTLRVWKSRNAIPDKYADATPTPDSQYVQDCANLREILSHEAINKACFNTHFGYLNSAKSFALGNIGIKENVYMSIKSEIDALKRAIEKLLISDLGKGFDAQLKSVRAIKCLKMYVLLSTDIEKLDIKRIFYNVDAKNDNNIAELAKVKKAVKEFYSKIDLMI